MAQFANNLPYLTQAPTPSPQTTRRHATSERPAAAATSCSSTCKTNESVPIACGGCRGEMCSSQCQITKQGTRHGKGRLCGAVKEWGDVRPGQDSGWGWSHFLCRPKCVDNPSDPSAADVRPSMRSS